MKTPTTTTGKDSNHNFVDDCEQRMASSEQRKARSA
jgi:hypothetical protein